ncbi:uncharacterized protein LOC113209726 [Frankliniella occidentalis]|uniref:Uncharacterized protein LOC113209726 n=1 Tax=Frankliniella occidentalis TaxID=133901 RepID=A0A6J1SXK9_FRAOC|nr:uncharacterized protein LOC113209726 [Frankliniella occidentalis]
MRALTWAWCAATAAVLLHAAEYEFDNAFYNQQLLDQVDDALRPWRSGDGGAGLEQGRDQGGRSRPRFRHKGGVLVARWFPSRRGEPAQYQWSWEVPPGVNQTAKLWWRRYYPYNYYNRRYCRYGYCRRYRGRGGYGYGYRRRGYGGYGGYGYRGRGYGYGGGGYGGYGGGYGGGSGGSGGYGNGYGRMGSAFDRMVLADDDATKTTTDRPASSSTAAHHQEAPPQDNDPNADVEDVSVNKDIAQLPEATDEQLDGVDAHPGHIPFQEQVCCGRPVEATLLRQDALREQCYLQVFNETVHSRLEEGQNWDHFSCVAVNEIKESIRCVHQCIWKLRETFDEDDEQVVSVSKLRGFFRDTESQRWRAELMDSAAVKCMAEYQTESRGSSETSRCPGAHLDLSYCLWEELQANCPEQEWNVKSRYCDRVRAVIRSRRGGAS